MSPGGTTIFILYQKPKLTLAQQILEMEHARQLAVVIGHGQKGDFVALHDAEGVGGQEIEGQINGKEQSMEWTWTIFRSQPAK